jgi:protoporphyrin/coproporphyrin ferrochelatase
VGFDAVLLVSFGGPEGADEVTPFLENVLRGRPVSPERIQQVAAHYHEFGGVSPINGQNRALVRALGEALDRRQEGLPVYWGNRNWHPFLADTLRQMQKDGVKNALGFVTSVFSSYSGCRQYLEDIEKARAELGSDAPRVEKLRSFYNHPLFIEAQSAEVRDALDQLPPDRRSTAQILFTAHSVPFAMAESSDYQKQLNESCRLVAEHLGLPAWRLVYQSRSGPPGQPWLEPDVGDVLREIPSATDVVIVPIGFVSDHMEVLYDLDTEARQICEAQGLTMVRASTVGVHPLFLEMIRELIRERMGQCPARAIGQYGPSHDECDAACCPAPARRASSVRSDSSLRV